jgi:acyl carrier protein
LEERFAIRVLDEELIPENLDSVASIVEFVKSKHAESCAA